MANKLGIFVIAIVFFLLGFSGVSALNQTNTSIAPTSSGFLMSHINKDANVQFNITLTTNTTDQNVSSVIITLAAGASFVSASNLTSNISGWTFVSSGNTLNYSWPGPGATTFPNTTSARFLFNITASSVSELPLIAAITVTMNGTGTLITENQILNVTTDGLILNQLVTVNFPLTGIVKNETGQVQNFTNVSIYRFVTQPNGPPLEYFVRSALTDANGVFTLTGVNATGYTSAVYKLKFVLYANDTMNLAGPAPGTSARKVGPLLPPLPGLVFSPPNFVGIDEFMLPPSLNGTTFNLQPAVTLNISATNSSTFQRFGYEVSDIASGYPFESAIFGSIESVQVIVPTGRDYNVMVARTPWNGLSGFRSDNLCDGNFMNASTCPAPPRSNASTGSLTATGGQIISVVQNMTDSDAQMYGCISVAGNTTPINNITVVHPRMLPYAGFVPPMKADKGDINIYDGAQVNMTGNFTATRCPASAIAWYNITLMNVNYLVDFYGSSASVSNTTQYTVGSIQNVSLSGGSVSLNFTLRPMLGSLFVLGMGEINTSKMQFNITNSTGSPLSNAPNVELQVFYPHTGKLRYMIDSTSISSGVFYFPIVNEAGAWAKALAYGQGPPVEQKVDLTRTSAAITIDDSAGFGFRRVHDNGTIERNFNVSAIPLQMRFLTNSVACSVINPAASCVITSMAAKTFNPFKAMMAGKVNMEMQLTTTNVTITYYNYDMFQAKPPTNTVLDEAAQSSGAIDIWRFGSFTPADVYDYAVIAMPYSDGTIDETKNVFVRVPVLYNDTFGVVWNRTAGDTRATLPYDYSQAKSTNYNSSGFVDYLSAAGVQCDYNNNNISTFFCHINTTSNMIYMRVPHFSGVGPQVDGTGFGGTTASVVGGSGGGGGGIGDTKSTVVLAKVEAGKPETISVDGKRVGIKEIVFEVFKEAKDVTVTVTKFASKPASITVAVSGTLYSYFDFSSSVPNTNIKSALVRFQVPQKWLAEKSADKTKITLLHWEANKWIDLGAKLTGEDTDYAYYESKTEGFSIFAVATTTAAAGAAPAEQITTTAQQQAARGTKTAAAQPQGAQPVTQTTAILLIVLIAVIAIVAYTMRPKKRRWR